MRADLRRTLSLALGLLALTLVFAPAEAGLFDVPDPQLVYEGTGPGLTPGVLVLRRQADFAAALEGLDPAFRAPEIEFKKRTWLRVVGRPRDNACRETSLKEVSTRNFSATIRLEERIPEAGCECGGTPRPPRVYIIAVARAVRRAKVEATDVVVSCQQAAAEAHPEPIVALYQGSWKADPGATLITGAAGYQEILASLGLGDRGPAVDFGAERAVVVTGRPRENGCRKTRVVAVELASAEEAVFTVEESYPGTGQTCTQIFLEPKVFLYRVPSTVSRVRVVTRDLR